MPYKTYSIQTTKGFMIVNEKLYKKLSKLTPKEADRYFRQSKR